MGPVGFALKFYYDRTNSNFSLEKNDNSNYSDSSGRKIDINQVFNPFRGPGTPKIEFSIKNLHFGVGILFFFDIFLTSKKLKVANRLKRVFPKFEADQSYVRGVNGRSMFQIFF